MRLSGEAARGAQAGCIHETRSLRRKAEVLLAQVQLAHIVIALAALFLRGDVAGAPRRMVGLKRELCGDLLEGVLGVGEAELEAKQCRFRRPAVGRGGGSYGVERRFDVLLGLLHQIRDVEHGFGPAKGVGENRLSHSQSMCVLHCAEENSNSRWSARSEYKTDCMQG